MSGFLAPGESLVDVIMRDEETLRAIGVSIEAVGQRIDAVLSVARRRARGLGPPVMTVGKYLVYGLDEISFGKQDCPFLDRRGRPCPAWGSQDYEIANPATGVRIAVTGLAAHLLLEHRFFQGSVPYRIDPLRAAEVLGLRPPARPSN